MEIKIPDNDLRRLRIIEIAPQQRSLDTLKPADIEVHGGLDLRPLVEGKSIFVDSVLGYVIARDDLAPNIPQKLDVLRKSASDDPVHLNWRAELFGNDAVFFKPQNDTPWYVERAGGWPRGLRGGGTTVAVIDDGSSARLLKDGKTDFASCRGLDMTPWSINDHGENCVRAIAESDVEGKRRSPAPDCRIVSAQATRGNGNRHIWLVDLLLMLSWAVICRSAQIVNMSFKLNTCEFNNDKQQSFIGRIAVELLKQNRALIFAAVDDNNNTIGYPARLPGITAVGSYSKGDHGNLNVAAGTDDAWQMKMGARELLFAPEGIRISDTEIFTGSSSSCAYVSGVAALYVERHLGKPKKDGTLYALSDIAKMLGENLGDMNIKGGPTIQGIKLHP